VARVPDALFAVSFVWVGEAFCFAVDPPHRPGEAKEEGSGGAGLGKGGGEGVGEGMEWEVGRELPEWKVGNAQEGASDDQGGMTVAADPVGANREGG